jgi:hypothetical protein
VHTNSLGKLQVNNERNKSLSGWQYIDIKGFDVFPLLANWKDFGGTPIEGQNYSIMRASYCWASPAQPFSDPRPVGLVTMFLLSQMSDLTSWRAIFLYLFPPGTG